MKDVIAYVHTHWDREWYREFEEFRLRLVEVFDEVLEALEKDNLPCFYFDGQIAALEDYLEIRPERTDLVKFFVKSRRLRVGPFYCSSDSFLVSGESLYRNLKYGIEKSREFGEVDFIGYIADSFGHSKDIPYLLKAHRINKACLWRGLGDLPADIEWNGIRVLNLVQGYFQDFLHSDLPIEQKAENLKKYLDKISQKSPKMLFLPIGADHLNILKRAVPISKELNHLYDSYRVFVTSPFDYFYRVYKSEKVQGEFLDNSKTFLLKGVYSCRPYIKRANAHSQWLLERIAEPLNGLCSSFLGAKNKQSELNYAFKELMKNHAHDSIYGCSLDEVAEDVMARFKTVNTVANGVIKRTVRDIEDDNGDLSVINLSNYYYSGKVFIETERELPEMYNAYKISSKRCFTDKKLYNINDIPVTEDITDVYTYLIDVKELPPFSLMKITQNKLCHEKHINADKTFIENANIKVEVKNNKIIMTDKKRNEVYKDFIVIKDRADIGDSYNFGALKKDKPISGIVKSFKVKEVSDIRAILNVVYEIDIPLTSEQTGRAKNTDKCKINCDITLYNQSEMAEFKLDWLNKSKNHILQLGLNLKEKAETTISEDLFSTVRRDFDLDYDIYKNIPAQRGVELKTNTAPMQRFVSVQNVTVLTKGISEYEVSKNNLYITLLRAVGIISNPINPTRGTPAGPPIETPQMQCLGENTAEFAIAFTNSEHKMYQLADEYYYPCVSVFTEKKDRIFFVPKGRVYALTKSGASLVSRVFTREVQNIVIKH